MVRFSVRSFPTKSPRRLTGANAGIATGSRAGGSGVSARTLIPNFGIARVAMGCLPAGRPGRSYRLSLRCYAIHRKLSLGAVDGSHGRESALNHRDLIRIKSV